MYSLTSLFKPLQRMLRTAKPIAALLFVALLFSIAFLPLQSRADTGIRTAPTITQVPYLGGPNVIAYAHPVPSAIMAQVPTPAPTPVPAPAPTSPWAPLLGQVITSLIGLLMAALTVAAGLLSNLLLKKSADMKQSMLVRAAEALGGKLVTVAKSVVDHLDAAVRPTLPGVLADGKLTADEKLILKQKAIDALKSMAPDLIQQIPSVLGVSGSGVDTLLSGLIESAVKSGKSSSPAPAAPAKSPASPQ